MTAHRTRSARIDRRTLLKGAGTTIALPWMESRSVWGMEKRNESDIELYPQRFAVLFMACGVHTAHWWAKGRGKEMLLGKSLMPLDPIKEKLNVVQGLFNQNANGVGIHPGQTGNILSGAALQKGAELKGGISIDQLLANQLGQETTVPSMVLGCEQPITGYHETNFSMAYSSHISWQNATSPVPMEVYPSLAFDSLFDNQGSRRNKSILDRVSEHAADIRRSVGQADRVKLDEFLSSVREVEKRSDKMRDGQEKAKQRSVQTGTSPAMMSRPENGLPEDIREHMRLMCDIVALALQTDRTRFASLLLCRDISGLFYPFLGVRNAHHSASHNDTSEDWEKISRFYCEQYAYLAGKLDSMQEADGTVLDHSCLMFVNNMWSGSRHDSTRVPLLLAGGLDQKLETGRVLDYSESADEDRKLCSLYISIANRMGSSLSKFGDAEKPLNTL